MSEILQTNNSLRTRTARMALATSMLLSSCSHGSKPTVAPYEPSLFVPVSETCGPELTRKVESKSVKVHRPTATDMARYPSRNIVYLVINSDKLTLSQTDQSTIRDRPPTIKLIDAPTITMKQFEPNGGTFVMPEQDGGHAAIQVDPYGKGEAVNYKIQICPDR